MLISIVLPCYNEAKLLPGDASPPGSRCTQKLGKERFEFIYVDDGSRDETAELLQDMSLADERVRGIRLIAQLRSSGRDYRGLGACDR